MDLITKYPNRFFEYQRLHLPSFLFLKRIWKSKSKFIKPNFDAKSSATLIAKDHLNTILLLINWVLTTLDSLASFFLIYVYIFSSFFHVCLNPFRVKILAPSYRMDCWRSQLSYRPWVCYIWIFILWKSWGYLHPLIQHPCL